MAGVDWTESTMKAAGTKLHVARAGRGRPVLVLHHETGTLDRLPFYDALAAHYDVLVPHHPGYSRSRAPGLDAERARHRGDLSRHAE